MIDDFAHPDDVSVPSAIPSLSDGDRKSRSLSNGDTCEGFKLKTISLPSVK